MHFWPGWRQVDYFCDEGGLGSLSQHKNININQRKETLWRLGYPKFVFQFMRKPTRTLKHNPERILNDFMNYNGGLKG